MPSFIWSDTLIANQLGQRPIAAWQFVRVPNVFVSGAYVAVLQRATTVNARQSMFSGSQNIVQRSPIQAGGTAGITPTSLNTPVQDWQATPDDLLVVENDEVGGAAVTIDGIITIEPL